MITSSPAATMMLPVANATSVNPDGDGGGISNTGVPDSTSTTTTPLDSESALQGPLATPRRPSGVKLMPIGQVIGISLASSLLSSSHTLTVQSPQLP